MGMYGFGRKNVSTGNRGGFYVQGQGTFERRPNVYVNDVGETVVQPGGVLRHTDGSLHQAYAAQPGSYIASLLEKWRRGDPLTDAERKAIEEYLATNPTAGLPSVNDLGGKRGASTKKGGSDVITPMGNNLTQFIKSAR